MDIHTALKTEGSPNQEETFDPNGSFEIKDFTASRIQAVKSLTAILMKEIELLEILTPKSEDFINNKKISLTEAVARFETELIRTALIQTRGHQKQAAMLLKIKVTTLNMKIKRYGIDYREFTFFNSQYSS